MHEWHFLENAIMKRLVIGILAAASAVAATIVLADDTTLINEMNMKPLTPAQSAQLKAERDAAQAQWAKLSDSQKDAVKKAAAQKKTGDLSAMERIGQNDDMKAMTKSESTQMKSEREAAEAKWNQMTPEQKAAARKAAQQKRAADLNAMERAGQADDMGRYFSY